MANGQDITKEELVKAAQAFKAKGLQGEQLKEALRRYALKKKEQPVVEGSGPSQSLAGESSSPSTGKSRATVPGAVPKRVTPTFEGPWGQDQVSKRPDLVINEQEQPVQQTQPFSATEQTASLAGPKFINSQPTDKEIDSALTDVSTSDWWKHKWNSAVKGASDFFYNVSENVSQGNRNLVLDYLEENEQVNPELYSNYQDKLKELKKSRPETSDDKLKKDAAYAAYLDRGLGLLGGAPKDPELKTKLASYKREKRIEGALEKYGFDLPEEKQRELDERFFSGAVSGLVQSGPAMLTSGTTGGLSFFEMAYNGAEDRLANRLNENPDIEMSAEQQETYKLLSAGAESVLEKVGLSNALKGTPILKGAIIDRAVAKAGKLGNKITPTKLAEIVSDEARALGVTSKRLASGFLAEAETGGLQGFSNLAVDEFTRDTKGERVFDEKSAGEWVKEILVSAGQEGIGGGLLSGPAAIRSGVKEYAAPVSPGGGSLQAVPG